MLVLEQRKEGRSAVRHSRNSEATCSVRGGTEVRWKRKAEPGNPKVHLGRGDPEAHRGLYIAVGREPNPIREGEM